MKTRPFAQVDVFTDRPYTGNPVAVVLDAAGLTDAGMQSIARWTNLSETTFVLPPDVPEADYRLRIFTPRAELPFAGHPTLGSAHALIGAGLARPRDGRLVQQCPAGLVPIETDPADACLWLTLPPAKQTPLPAAAGADLAAALGLACDPGAAVIDVGAVWIVARVASGEALLRSTPDLARIATISRAFRATGVTAFGPVDEGAARYEVRSFAPAVDVPEDPVCGSGNGCVAAWLAGQGTRIDYTARQGRAIGRDGQVRVAYGEDGSIRIGGRAVACVRGTIDA